MLYDTYGYPLELTQEIAAREGFAVDLDGFEREMEAQRERGRAAAKFEIEADRTEAYAQLAHIKHEVRRLRRRTGTTRRSPASSAPAGVQDAADDGRDGRDRRSSRRRSTRKAAARSGDGGEIVAPGGRVVVDDTQSAAEGLIVHRGRVVEGRIAVNDAVTRVASIREARRASQRNHTATHLLHAALREVLGDHVRQAGSLVAPGPPALRLHAHRGDEAGGDRRGAAPRQREDPRGHRRPLGAHAVRRGCRGRRDGALRREVPRERARRRHLRRRRQQTADNRQQTRAPACCFSKELCGGTHCPPHGRDRRLRHREREQRRLRAAAHRGADGRARRRVHARAAGDDRAAEPPPQRDAGRDRAARRGAAVRTRRRTPARAAVRARRRPRRGRHARAVGAAGRWRVRRRVARAGGERRCDARDGGRAARQARQRRRRARRVSSAIARTSWRCRRRTSARRSTPATS